LYYIELDNKTTRGLLLNCLSFPADLIYDNSNQILYVAETFTNRIIRLIQNPPGVYHSSIFHQFDGRLGPTAITMDEMGNIYVARFEFQVNKLDFFFMLILFLKKRNTYIIDLFNRNKFSYNVFISNFFEY